MSITYPECVSVALGIRHALRIRHTIICGLPSSVLFFPHYLINGTIFETKVIEYKICVWIFLYKFGLKHHSEKSGGKYDRKIT